ncbi:MAG TPA: PglZ domain-containing protein, partial [Pirellulales bacterium]|nr:PglZ domain-containing protein [Pirellulales bacterium]
LQRARQVLGQDGAVAARLVVSTGSAPALAAFVIRQAVVARFEAAAPWPQWTEGLSQHELVREYRRGRDSLGDSQRRLAALMCAASDLAGVENALATPLPSFSAPEQILDWYVEHGLHLLEYRTAEAFARLETVDDPTLHRAGYEFVMREPNGLRFRVRAFLNRLDAALAAFIERDPQKFVYGPRSAVRIIPDVLRGGKRQKYARVWVLVMDGMRFDTWQAVVRPLLLEHFEVVDGQDRPFFSLLPSKTDVARRGLLAGALGKDWKNFFQKPTKEERVLAARALGLTNQDLATRMAFVTDAETTEARERLGYDADEGRDANVLIYPISDDLGHYHNDTLASLNEKIKQQLLTQQGRRGIVDDLRRRVRPGDLVLLTSDHGFQELFAHEQVRVSRLEALSSGASEDDVAYRYLWFEPKKPPTSGTHLSFPWEEIAHDGKKISTVFTLAVGGTWYQREKGRPTRFAHGGVSLAEMTIPCVLLKPIEQKAARVEILDLPREMSVAEDETAILAFDLANTGNVDARFELTVKTNLGEQLIPQKQGTLAAGRREHFTCAVRGRIATDRDRSPIADKTTTAVMLDLAHEDLSGGMIRPGYGNDVVRVSVKPKPTKIDTDVLKAFDDL